MHSLTKPQKLIYDMEKFAGGSIATVCGSIVIKGKQEISEITNAVNEIYRLNDALRIRLTEKDGMPQQYITEYEKQEINVLHFENKAELDPYALKFAREPMDFYGSLCDIKAITLDDCYGILVKLHHIISDAWTLTLLGSQFAQIMNGKMPETYSYLDYIAEEEKYLSGKRYLKDRDYYIEQFKKCDEVTYLSDKQVSSYIADRKTFVIDADKTAKLMQYAEKHNTSLFMLLMTALGVYINRIKMNEEKFYVGTAVLNRSGLKEQNTAGMFINTVPFLFELQNEKTFSENLETIANTSMSIFRHQKFNYGDILKTLRSEFDFSGNLYDVMLSYQNAKITGAENAFETTWYPCGMQTESLQIHIDDRDREGILKIHYDYQTEKFTKKEIERMCKHIFNLLFDAIENDTKKIYELEILSQTEKDTLLYDFNNTKVDYPKDKCIHQLFEEQTLKTPEKTALKFGNLKFTYQELNGMANNVAAKLKKMGVGRNDIVALISKRSYHLVVAILGILKAGGAYLPIDYNYPQERIDYIIDDAKCKAIVTFDLDIDKDNVLRLENEISLIEENLPCINAPEDLCAVIYTSGSTGTPKGTLLHHNGIVNYIYANNALYEGGQCNLGFSIYTFDAFFLDLIPPMIRGSISVMATEDEQYQQKEFENLIKENPKCNLFITPAKLKQFIDGSDNKSFINEINKICIGGEVFPDEFIELFNKDTKVFNVYGPTECSMWTLEYPIKNNDITVGKPLNNVKIYILDKYGKPTPIGMTGELCIAGDCVGSGYLNRPELTTEKFVDNSFGKGKMYKTGDLAYWREDGNIAYVGRNDFQVKIRGLRIELGEIESAICSVEGVSQAVVVMRKDETGRQLICAFYTEKSPVNLFDIKASISTKLPQYMMPHIFTVLQEMPLTPSGKINRKALPEVDFANITNDTEYVKPQTELQKNIAKLMEEVLNYSPVGLNDNFFELGGDSLKAIEFVSKAHSEGIYFGLQDMFENQTLKKLCEQITNKDRDNISFADVDFSNTDKVLSNNKIEKICLPSKNNVGNILLAGATGFLGMHILSDFLENDNGNAYCLVRGIDKESAKERFYELLHFYFGEKYDDNDRIVVICAELHKTKFNLTDNEYNMLLSNVDTVINAAASVKHYGSYEYFYEANVETVHQLIDFCKKTNAKLIHASTLSVSGNSFEACQGDSEIRFGEDNLYIGQPLDNVYARSKFEAEKDIIDAIADGLKTNIMRLGFLTNRYTDGVFQRNYESNAFLKRIIAIIKLGIIPKSFEEMLLEFTPIDLAANAIMTITRNFSSKFNVFHICNTKTISMGKLIKYLQNMDINVDVVEDAEFYMSLENNQRNDDQEGIFEAFANDFKKGNKLDYSSKIVLDNSFSVEYLRKLGFEWSDIGLEYLKKYIEYFRGIGYLEV